MSWDIDTKEGMSNAKEWFVNLIKTINENGSWYVPRANSTYMIKHSEKTLIIYSGPGDAAVNRVARECGWSVVKTENN